MRYLIVCFISCFFCVESFGQKKIVKKLRQAPISISPKNFNDKKVSYINKDSISDNENGEPNFMKCTTRRYLSCTLHNKKSAIVKLNRTVLYAPIGVAISQDYRLSIRGARPDANIVLIDGIRAIEYENAFIPFDEGQTVKVKTQ